MTSISGEPRPYDTSGPGWSSPLHVQADSFWPGRLGISQCSLTAGAGGRKERDDRLWNVKRGRWWRKECLRAQSFHARAHCALRGSAANAMASAFAPWRLLGSLLAPARHLIWVGPSLLLLVRGPSLVQPHLHFRPADPSSSPGSYLDRYPADSNPGYSQRKRPPRGRLDRTGRRRPRRIRLILQRANIARIIRVRPRPVRRGAIPGPA